MIVCQDTATNVRNVFLVYSIGRNFQNLHKIVNFSFIYWWWSECQCFAGSDTTLRHNSVISVRWPHNQSLAKTIILL